jgi:aryl-alcohol dehydrogenase-like predicted oxidoreductase
MPGADSPAVGTARDRNLQRFSTEQPPSSLLVRRIELDDLPTAERHGTGILLQPTLQRMAVRRLGGRQLTDLAGPSRSPAERRWSRSMPSST